MASPGTSAWLDRVDHSLDLRPQSHSVNSNAVAATYYVSPSGSDSNPGSSAQPWRTVQKAANAAAAGDTVMVRAGTYYERVQINVSGTARSPSRSRESEGPTESGLPSLMEAIP